MLADQHAYGRGHVIAARLAVAAGCLMRGWSLGRSIGRGLRECLLDRATALSAPASGSTGAAGAAADVASRSPRAPPPGRFLHRGLRSGVGGPTGCLDGTIG